MKTLLVPIDLSAITDNAINFALKWAKEYEYERIILLKTFYETMFDNLISSADYMHVNSDYLSKEREETLEHLNELYEKVQNVAGPNLKISVEVSELPILRAILAEIEEEQPQLIIIGSDNYNEDSSSLVASNAISIAKVSPIRVLIVPSNYEYRPVEQVLVPVNFNMVEPLDKIDSYNTSSAKWREKKLLVLNVDAKEKYLQPDENFKNSEIAIHDYLKNFSHELFYSNNKNTINGILDFSTDHGVQLIVALPGKYSFLYSLTHKSITEAIYKNASKPVLILK